MCCASLPETVTENLRDRRGCAGSERNSFVHRVGGTSHPRFLTVGLPIRGHRPSCAPPTACVFLFLGHHHHDSRNLTRSSPHPGPLRPRGATRSHRPGHPALHPRRPRSPLPHAARHHPRPRFAPAPPLPAFLRLRRRLLPRIAR